MRVSYVWRRYHPSIILLKIVLLLFKLFDLLKRVDILININNFMVRFVFHVIGRYLVYQFKMY